MAKSSSAGTQRRYGASAGTKALRTLTWLLILIIGITGLNWLSVAFQGGSWLPQLALDLEGGTQIVLEAQLPEGSADPSSEQMQQAVSIIRQRVDAAGVSEAEITTQGGRNIVVAVPGEMDDATRERIENSARLDFRPVIVADQAANSQVIPPEMLPEDISTTPTAEPTGPSDISYVTEAMQVEFIQFDCASDIKPASEIDPTQPLITCDETGQEKYILGPVEVSGSNITDASHGLAQTQTGATTNEWVVSIEFDEAGTQAFSGMTERLYGLQEAQNRFAATMDNRVIVAPTTNAIITDGNPQISGSLDEASAKALADQLKFGALPFSFETQSSQTISATLGTSQLISGLIAGVIGLGLVIVYSVFQYRVLGLVTIASLTISATITYLVVTYLSSQEGYRLSLAGVAGLIVAIGITADSFIVYFERIKDELRDGKSLPSAVEAGWSRAFRTIVVSDAVNLLVAIVLFFIAVGNVRGFALTLGLTTLIDVLVVTMFTHPLMRLLAQTRFFGGGHPASGLDPRALGAVYRGRGSFRVSAEKRKGAAREAEKRRTLAERKAAEARGETLDDLDESEETETSSSRRKRSKSKSTTAARARGSSAKRSSTATLERDDENDDLDDDAGDDDTIRDRGGDDGDSDERARERDNVDDADTADDADDVDDPDEARGSDDPDDENADEPEADDRDADEVPNASETPRARRTRTRTDRRRGRRDEKPASNHGEDD